MRSILKLAGLSALLLSIHSAGGEEGLFRSTSACSQEAVCDSAQPEAPMPDNPMPKTIHILAPEFYCTNASVVTVRVLALPEAFEAGVFVKIKSMVESTPATPGPSAASVPFVEKDISGSISSGVVPDAAYDGNHGGLYDFGTVDLDVALHDPSVSMKDRKIWAIAYREGFNPAGEKVFTSGHEPAQLTQIKVDLDGREPGGADVVPDEEEESPGVLLASGSSKLVVQSILAAAGTAGGTLTLTWPDLFEGNKKLKVTRDDDGTEATDGTLSIDCAATALPLTLSLTTLKQQTGGTWAEAEWDPDDQITVTMQHSGVAQCIDQVKLPIIKVDFLNASKTETAILKVAKWKDAFEDILWGPSVKANFIDLDPDKFYVRVNDQSKNGSGTITIKLSSDGPGTDYDDNATEIDLTETGANTGIFETESLLLMSGDVDDNHPVGGIDDDTKNDRTHKVALDATVMVEYPSGTPICTTTATSSADKTVTLHVNILKVDGAGVLDAAAVEGDMKQIVERFAQIQIIVNYTIESPVEPPEGVNLSDGLDEHLAPDAGGIIPMTVEEKNLLGAAALRTASEDDIEVYYVNSLSLDSLGLAFGASNVPDAKYKNSVILSRLRYPYAVPAHEVGHVLLDTGSHYAGVNKAQNLMSKGAAGTGASHTVLSQKRLTESQANSMRTSSLAK